MSRGLGPTQRRVLDILYEGPKDGGLPVAELKAHLGGDRSNVRRAIRGLVAREMIEETVVGDERGFRLTPFKAGVIALERADHDDPPERSELLAELRALREEKDQKRAALRQNAPCPKTAEGSTRRRRQRRPVRRRRRLGETQQLVLSVLAQGVDGELQAFETTFLKRLVADQGGPTDKSNLHRAIRSLWNRGYIQEWTQNGLYHYELTLVGYMVAVPLDPATAPRLIDP